MLFKRFDFDSFGVAFDDRFIIRPDHISPSQWLGFWESASEERDFDEELSRAVIEETKSFEDDLKEAEEAAYQKAEAKFDKAIDEISNKIEDCLYNASVCEDVRNQVQEIIDGEIV